MSIEDIKPKAEGGLPRICVFATYFGPLPNWFRLWAASCGANADIDFIVVTDQAPEGLPQNVRVYPETLSGIKKRLEKSVGMPIALTKAYKLCDYKPFLGLAYSDLIDGYDYWGHSDLDLFFGDMRSFFAKYDLEKYDKFLSLGHFFLYRNTPEVNSTCLNTLHGEEFWREVISSDKNYYYDEKGMNFVVEEHGLKLYRGHPFADIATIYTRVRMSPKYKDYKKEVFYWKDGKAGRLALRGGGALVDDDLLYVHFQKRPYPVERVEAEPGEDFYFGSYGFVPMNGLEVADAVERVNPFDSSLELGEDVRWRYRDLRRKLSTVKRSLLNGRD